MLFSCYFNPFNIEDVNNEGCHQNNEQCTIGCREVVNVCVAMLLTIDMINDCKAINGYTFHFVCRYVVIVCKCHSSLFSCNNNLNTAAWEFSPSLAPSNNLSALLYEPCGGCCFLSLSILVVIHHWIILIYAITSIFFHLAYGRIVVQS